MPFRLDPHGDGHRGNNVCCWVFVAPAARGGVRIVLGAIKSGGETEFDSIGKNPMVEIQPLALL